MANPNTPGIKFNASYMAGYNNPEITVLTLVTDNSTKPVIYPSYGNILRLLKSGRVPLLLLTDESRQTGYLMQLAYYSTSDRVISFASTYAESNVAGVVFTIDFSVGKPPVIRQIPLQRPNP